MEGGGFSRWPLLQLQTMNSPQVIIDVQCHVHSKRQRNLPAFAKEKQQLQLPGAHEYHLCTEDNQRATGFAEVMSAGCFPAFITSDGYVCPFEDDIDLNSTSISFEPDTVDKIMVKLYSYTSDQVLEMQKQVIRT